jgi:hypothetical protein
MGRVQMFTLPTHLPETWEHCFDTQLPRVGLSPMQKIGWHTSRKWGRKRPVEYFATSVMI